MSNPDTLQPPINLCHRESEMCSVEMYPSSAVAQTHLSGSAHIGTLQQPPPSTNASSLHHHRTSSIFQNPSFDNKHSAFRSADVSVSVNKVSTQQLHQQSNTTCSATEKTITSTNTATSSAMMIDDPVAANVVGKGSTDVKSDKNGEAKQPPAEAGAEQTDDAGSSSAVRKVRFRVGSKYKVCEIIGEGAYGVVCSAIHRATGQKVAIKKIQPFEHQMFALRTLRELKLLRFFQECDVSENIISILDIIKPNTYEAFTEVYLVQELMETDLHRVIRTQELSDDHCQYFTYQTLRALKPMHCADVIHRDLKPSNVLLNANCDLKVCDFGLARSVLTADQDTGFMTEYVATRWYRAPEIMLTFKQYTKAIDVWAVGCILAEMLSGRPLFPGRDYHQQLSLILDVLGTPTLEEFHNINSRRSRDYIRSMPFRKRRDFRTLFPKASPEAIDFLQKTLTFDPRNRLTVEECLAHPYLSAYHDPDDEPGAPRLDPDFFYFDMQKESITKEDLRKELWYQVQEFQPLLR